ncbi:MAG: ABC transporter permease [Opitutae bacterium]|nr:ABC transporter permease [Opitutae bacterium]
MAAAKPTRSSFTGLRAMEWFLRGWTALVFAFLYVPILVLVAYSFNDSRLNVVWTGFTFRWFVQLFDNAPLMRAAYNSLVIAAATTVFSVVLGTLGAWLLHRYRYHGARAVQTLFTIPMVVPEVLMGISLLILFAAVDLSLGFTTVIIAHVTFCFPFVLVAVQARLHDLDPALEEAALDLGATPLQAFWLVILPSLRPAIIAGALMAFTLSLDELIVTFFTTSASSATLPVRVFGMAKVGLNPMLNALSALFVLVTITVVVFSHYLRRLGRGSSAPSSQPS